MKIDLATIDRGAVIKWASVIILVAIAFFVVRKAIKSIKSDSTQNQLDAEIKANQLSYPLNQYISMADQIDGSFTYLTTDEDTIYRVFKKMNTLSDVLQLNKAFGVRKFYGFFGDASLAVFLTKGMDAKEVAEINKILKTNNVNFSF